MNKKTFCWTLLVVLSAILGSLSGCSSGADRPLTFSQLISQADKYNSKNVTIEAFYFSGFEIQALSESVGPASSGPWRLVPTGTLIWVEGGISLELQNRLYGQTTPPSGYTERIGKLKVSGQFQSGGKYGHLDGFQYQIKVTNAELLEWSPPPAAPGGAAETQPAATPPVTSIWDNAEARKAAEDFILHSSTFKFDGLEGSLKFIEAGPSPISAYMSTILTYEFRTANPGHGNRTGQFLADVIATHKASILVNLEKNTIVMAACDGAWDMLKEKDLPVNVAGLIVDGGDTTLPDGPMDTPRRFVYRILSEEGRLIKVSFTAYPPSPAGDAARAKITLDFYQGEIRVGDKLEARGTLDKESGTVVVADQGDYIRTSLHKASVVGVVVDIEENGISGSREGKPDVSVYEILREDGTYVFVRKIAQQGVAISLHEERVKVGDFLKAIGNYEKESNTLIVEGEFDMIKTYEFRPEP